MAAIADHEERLGRHLAAGLAAIPGVTRYGPPADTPHTPTFAFTVRSYPPHAVARHLGERGVFVSSGHFYAPPPVERLGLAGRGGLVRPGLAPYNLPEEVDRLLEALEELAG